MRWSVRWGAAAAAAAILVGGFVAPASATTAIGSAPADPTSPSPVIQVPDAPFNRTINANYHTTPAGEPSVSIVPASVETLTLALPAEAAALALTTIRWTVRAASSGSNGTAEVHTADNTITIPLATGFLSGTAPRLDGDGRPYFHFNLSATRDILDAPAPYSPTGDVVLTKTATLSLFGSFYLGDPGDETSAAIDLARENASTFASTRSYWGQAPDGLWIGAGDELTVTGGGIEWAPDSTAIIAPSPSQALDGSQSIQLAVSAADPSVMNATLSSDADLSRYLDSDRSAALAATLKSGDDRDYVFASLTIGAPTSVDGIGASRISGWDRFETADAVARAQYPRGVGTVFVATGDTFADALSVAPVAALNGAPVMLATANSGNYLDRIWDIRGLNPSRVVIIGGQSAVPYEWEPGIAYGGSGIATVDVQRIAGADRFEVSRNVALQEFPQGAKTVFLASGLNFPDALAAVPAAVSQKAPIILVRGGDDSLDSQTTEVLQSLGATKIVIVGGPVAVSAGIEAELRSRYSSGVTRFGGADRFVVADAINRAYFGSAPTAYLATGISFTDALTGSVMAAKEHAPLLLSRPDCVPASELDSLDHWKTSKVTLFGGVESLNRSVMSLQGCG